MLCARNMLTRGNDSSFTPEEWKQLADGFFKKWNFSQLCWYHWWQTHKTSESVPALVPYIISIMGFCQQHLTGFYRLKTTSLCDVTLVVFCKSYLASGNAWIRTYLSGSFTRLRRHMQSCATVRTIAFLIVNGDNKNCYATQHILAHNSNRLSHFVLTQMQLIVPLLLSFVKFQTMLSVFNRHN